MSNRLARGLQLSFGTVTDKSTTGTAAFVNIIAANANRLGYLIENYSNPSLNTNGDNIYVRLGLTGAAWEVLPGGYFPPPQLEGWMGDVYVNATATTQFAAAEMT